MAASLFNSVSAERPFGVYLFDYFDKAYTSVVGKSATEFTFTQGYTPLSTLPEGRFHQTAMQPAAGMRVLTAQLLQYLLDASPISPSYLVVAI